MMNEIISQYFTWPFTIGAIYLGIIVIIRFVRWVIGLSKIDKIRILKNVFTIKTWDSIKEAVSEGLLHRKIFKTNSLLGYMHMSLAFGWFLLIIIGHIETIYHEGTMAFPFYKSIFFRYFVHESTGNFIANLFSETMDLLLLFVLSGVFLAYYKRINSRIYGIKRTTKLKSGDKIALSALWLIFPLRLLAESFSAGIHNNGGFLTQLLGNLLYSSFSLEPAVDYMWLAYSMSLGFFFIALPNSRYMHIPTEILLIFLRKYGVNLKKRFNTYSQIQVFSCSRCGICLDSCQLMNAEIKNTQSVYVLKSIRNKSLTDETLFNCLLCGRCQNDCPVGIELNDLRITQRIESTFEYNSSYEYLEHTKAEKADVVYFAGCMTHLTPAIKKSMQYIFNYAGINYWFMDEDKAPCCGRPLMQMGQYDAAQKLIENNRQRIIESGAHTLVASCPICYKVFKEDYSLPHIKIMHHSEYLLDLVYKTKIPYFKPANRIIYHDPCELGRGSNIYEQPRELLGFYTQLIPIQAEKDRSYCCGGSLANIKIQMHEREKIMNSAINEYLKYEPDFLVTSCPLCKKTFAKNRELIVKDIAEIVCESLQNQYTELQKQNEVLLTQS
ncbi:MAG: 4Fe-4S dicluster domain-containing protein [Bacteroidales bacterium]|nr:4Fe-4S dicluster domain-containing protein [Bacteroidales bacterium]